MSSSSSSYPEEGKETHNQWKCRKQTSMEGSAVNGTPTSYLPTNLKEGVKREPEVWVNWGETVSSGRGLMNSQHSIWMVQKGLIGLNFFKDMTFGGGWKVEVDLKDLEGKVESVCN